MILSSFLWLFIFLHLLQSLEDLIVLRIEKSLDFHVAVSAKYVRSCYGMSLQELVHTLQPVSTTVLPVDFTKPENVSGAVGSADSLALQKEGKLSIPKELWRLVDALWAGNALKEKDLFNSKANPEEVKYIHSNYWQFSSFTLCKCLFLFCTLLTCGLCCVITGYCYSQVFGYWYWLPSLLTTFYLWGTGQLPACIATASLASWILSYGELNVKWFGHWFFYVFFMYTLEMSNDSDKLIKMLEWLF